MISETEKTTEKIWTQKVITKPGWYWAKLTFTIGTYITIVNITEKNIARKRLQIFYDKYFVYPYEFKDDGHCEFSDEILPPGEY